jgi:predicted nucleic acid-binding protein
MARRATRNSIVFVDTWAWVALANAGDRYHSLAKRIQASLDAARTRYATSEYILVEATTLLRRQMGFLAAERFLSELETARVSGGILWFPAEERLIAAGRQEFSRYGPSQVISFTDATARSR